LDWFAARCPAKPGCALESFALPGQAVKNLLSVYRFNKLVTLDWCAFPWTAVRHHSQPGQSQLLFAMRGTTMLRIEKCYLSCTAIVPRVEIIDPRSIRPNRRPLVYF
jgi:hypothetical protein